MPRTARTLLTLGAALALGAAGSVVGAAPAQALTNRFPTATGCAINGYCWYFQGPKTDDPAASNGMTWKLNNTPGYANVGSYVTNAINAINANGSGVTQKWGGTTTDTGTSSATPWLVRMVTTTSYNTIGGGCVADSLACAAPITQSGFGIRCIVWVNGGRYAQGGSTWQGTFIHEMLHCMGLSHFDGTYLGVYQLMKSSTVNAPNSIQTGDSNGIKNVTKPA